MKFDSQFMWGFGTGVVAVWALHRWVKPMATTKAA